MALVTSPDEWWSRTLGSATLTDTISKLRTATACPTGDGALRRDWAASSPHFRIPGSDHPGGAVLGHDGTSGRCPRRLGLFDVGHPRPARLAPESSIGSADALPDVEPRSDV